MPSENVGDTMNVATFEAFPFIVEKISKALEDFAVGTTTEMRPYSVPFSYFVLYFFFTPLYRKFHLLERGRF